MIRFLYSICFLVIGMGLPLSAKDTGTDSSTPSTSSKAGTRGVSSSCIAPSSAVAQQKQKNHKKSEIATRTVRGEERGGMEMSPLVTRNSSPVSTEANPGRATAGGRLARVTAYWAAEGDYYTERCISATGVRLHDGHCAVDPSIIPYGSVVEIAGVGRYLAVDTGSAVISRTAAREGGHTSAERNALVIDLYFESRVDGEKFAASASKYASISWWTPTSTATDAKAARSLFAEENWSKIQSKQL